MNTTKTKQLISLHSNYNLLAKSYFLVKGYSSRGQHLCFTKTDIRSFSNLPIYNKDITSPINEIFNHTISSVYVSAKTGRIDLILNIHHINSIDFPMIILKRIPFYCPFIVFVKVRYNIDEFFMAGNQFVFNYYSSYEIQPMFDIVISRLNQYLDDYNLTEYDISYIQLAFRQKDKKLLSEFSVQ